jgi:hypothetical protein
MRVLLDECLPRRLAKEIVGHEVRTVAEMGWSGRKNGELLSLMVASKFEVFLTGDQNLRYQQNLVSIDVAVIALCAASNQLGALRKLVPSLLVELETVRKGELKEIKA